MIHFVLCVIQALMKILATSFLSVPLLLSVGLRSILIGDMSLPLPERFSSARAVHDLDFFTKASLIAAWEIWKMRNNKILRQQDPVHSLWLVNFKNQCYLESLRFRSDLRSTFYFWLDASS